MSSAPIEALGLTHADAEIAILHAMREDDNLAIELAQVLEPEEFHDTRRGLVFEAMRNILRGIEPIDTDGIVAECRHLCDVHDHKFRITTDYIETLTGNYKRAKSYVNTVKRLAWLRQAGGFAFWLVQELQTRPDPDELYTAAQERWQHIAPARNDNRFVYGWDTQKTHSATIKERIQKQEAGELVRFDWPWHSWDRIRPLRPGFVGILAAPDGQGKTTYLECIAEHWAAQGWHTVYVHLEDAFDYKMDRRLARHAMVPLANIEDGKLSDAERHKIDDAYHRMSKWTPCLHYYHAAGQTMADILRELRTRIDEGVCQAVVFDYLDKVQPTRGHGNLFGDNTWERQAYDMEQLKAFAETNAIPVMTATQGNKSMQGEGMQTRKAIQGSGQKSQKSQLVIILTRDLVGENGLWDKNGQKIADPGEYSPLCKLRVDKQNRGPTHGFEQFLVGEYFAVRDLKR